MRTNARWVHCKECRRNRQHEAHGLCRPCYAREYYQANKNRLKAYIQDWRQANPDKVRKQYQQWAQANRERKAASDLQWQRANPDKVAMNNLRRRVRKANVESMSYCRAEIFKRDGICMLCSLPIEHIASRTIDHIKAIALRGPDIPENALLVCGSCNSSKQETSLEDWILCHPYAVAWAF